MRVIGTLLVGTLCVCHVLAAQRRNNLHRGRGVAGETHHKRARRANSASEMAQSNSHQAVAQRSEVLQRDSSVSIPKTHAVGELTPGSLYLPKDIFRKVYKNAKKELRKKHKLSGTKTSSFKAQFSEEVMRRKGISLIQKWYQDCLNSELSNEGSEVYKAMMSLLINDMKKSNDLKKRKKSKSKKKLEGATENDGNNHEERTKSLIELQMDLFIMTTTTVFRNLEEEGQYKITPEIRQQFDPSTMYEEALNQDIPWRQWNAWLRSKIVPHLKKVNQPNGERRRLSSSNSRGVLRRLRRTRLRH